MAPTVPTTPGPDNGEDSPQANRRGIQTGYAAPLACGLASGRRGAPRRRGPVTTTATATATVARRRHLRGARHPRHRCRRPIPRRRRRRRPTRRPAASAPSGRTADQRQFAARVDLLEFDLDLLADGGTSSTASIRLPPRACAPRRCAADRPCRAAGRQGAEGRRLHDGPRKRSPISGHLRVGGRVDHRPRRLRRRTVGRAADVDGAIVLDGDLRAGLSGSG